MELALSERAQPVYNAGVVQEVVIVSSRRMGRELGELAVALCGKVRERIASNEAARHLLDADRELLLAVRSCIDGKVNWIDSIKAARRECKPDDQQADQQAAQG